MVYCPVIYVCGLRKSNILPHAMYRKNLSSIMNTQKILYIAAKMVYAHSNTYVVRYMLCYRGIPMWHVLIYLPPITRAFWGSMNEQHPVTATRAPSTTLAISLVLKLLSPLYIWTRPETTVWTVPALAQAKDITNAIRPIIPCDFLPAKWINSSNSLQVHRI